MANINEMEMQKSADQRGKKWQKPIKIQVWSQCGVTTTLGQDTLTLQVSKQLYCHCQDGSHVINIRQTHTVLYFSF